MTDAERAELSRLRDLEIDDQLSIAGKAWNAIRKPDDNDWINLPFEMRHKLSHLAEKALAGRTEAEGDYAPAGFFAKVRELLPDDRRKAAVLTGVAYKVENPAKSLGMDTRTGERRERGVAQRRITDTPFDHPERRSVPERRQLK